ncbi:carboxypeptidase-like regulatory domain-containing protein [Ohtaekwangia sp.]|uniref:carboxypeptidase-like regulatory domain-containing protein n=1 Tax=Ohtaekwangia sp. TaxID=2066019 RepID=UPI002F922DE7
MNIRIILLYVFLLIIPKLKGQQYITVTGELRDSLEMSPVQFAHIFIRDENYGTFSNEAGKFQLNIDTGLAHETLTISCVGYKTITVKIQDIAGSNRNILYLMPHLNLLPEVTVQVNAKDTLKEYVLDAVKMLRQNYPRHKYILDGFYRELSVKDSVYTRVLEAAVSMEDNGYGPHDFDKEDLTITSTKIKVHEVRKSDDMRTYTFLGKAFEFLFGKKNNLYITLGNDFVRYIGRKSDHFLSNAMLNEYEYSLQDIFDTDLGKQFVILLSDKHLNSFFYREVSLYINASDKAIVKIENIMRPNPNDAKGKSYAYGGDFFAKSEVSYTKYKGRYYLEYIDAWYYSAGATAVLSREGSDTPSLQFDHLTFMVNAVYNKQDELERIRKRESVKKDIDLYEEHHEYNPEFWKNYNMILLNPLDKKAKSDLEKNTSLEDQYNKKRN